MKLAPKLTSATTDKPFIFEASDAVWSVVERHTGGLSEDKRDRLSRILRSYCRTSQSAANAPEVSIALSQIDKLRKTADALWEELNSELNAKQREAAHIVERLINEQMKRLLRWRLLVGPDPTVPGALRPIDVEHLATILTEFLSACDTAPSKLQATDYWASSWNRMVGDLATFYEELSREHRATAPNDRKPKDAPSKFVAFVNAVQFELPVEYRQHHHASVPDRAGTPLQSQISKVLASWRREKAAART